MINDPEKLAYELVWRRHRMTLPTIDELGQVIHTHAAPLRTQECRKIAEGVLRAIAVHRGEIECKHLSRTAATDRCPHCGKPAGQQEG